MISQVNFPTIEPTGYFDLRHNIRTGDIVLFNGQGMFSKAIQKYTKSIWSHVGLILKSKELDRVFICESLEPDGVRMVRLSKRLTDDSGIVILRHEEFHHAKNKRFAQYATDLLGAEYDKKEIIRISREIVRERLGLDMLGHKPNDKLICSEYAAACLASVGVKVKWNKLNYIAPSDYANDINIELVAVMKRPKE